MQKVAWTSKHREVGRFLDSEGMLGLEGGPVSCFTHSISFHFHSPSNECTHMGKTRHYSQLYVTRAEENDGMFCFRNQLERL